MVDKSIIANSNETPFRIAIQGIIKSHGNYDFLTQTLENQNATKHIIQSAEFKTTYSSIFFYIFSALIIGLSLTGFFNIMPPEVTFLLPAGIGMFWAVRRHTKKLEAALHSLSNISRDFGKI
jgi:hypothetical protein